MRAGMCVRARRKMRDKRREAVVVLAGTTEAAPHAVRESDAGDARRAADNRKAELIIHPRLMRPLTHVTTCLLLVAVFALSACHSTAPPRALAESKTGAAAPAAPAIEAARWDDSDSDGLPDRAELHSYNDRENFRRWFTAIAERQFYAASGEWNAAQRDCAGLVRFAWREALRPHDRAWVRRMGEGYDAVAPDVRAYTLERGPLGEKIFRTDFGGFEEADLQAGKFSEFADARTLKDFNTEFVSRDRREARAGDLLFFHQPWVQKYPYHVMLYLGAAREEAEGAGDWVVYHTGASAEDPGEVRKLRLSTLDRHPDPRWRPLERNRHFLGFYRLKILQ